MRGRVLELAADGAVLWEFTEPRRAGAEGELVPAVFDCVLVPELPDLLRD